MKKKLLFFFGLLSMLCFNAVAQTTVSGTVTDDSKAPLPGVSVVVKGTSTGTVTNIDGEFKLTLPDGSDALLFSFIGYKTQEVAIGSKTVFNIEMESDTEVLEEVVVTAVGIEQNKQNIGYSLQNVSGDEIAQARETNLVSALSGKMAGVNVIQSSGSPGAASKIFIRGNSSITGNNNPLFVIDGIPMNNTAPSGTTGGVDQSNRAIDLNPNDIASMTVLKGAAATALYGVRASNGAIIITTKRGTTGKAQVEFSTGFTIDKVNKLPEKQELYAQGRPQGGALTHRGPDTGEGYSWGPLISDLEFDGSAYDYDKGGRLVAKGTGNGIPARAYDNYDNFFVNGITTQNDISVRGGSEKTKYFVSLGHLASTGIVPNSDFERLTGRINVDTDITDKLKAGMSMFFTNTGGNRIQRGSNVSGVALGLFRTTPTFDNANGYSSGNDAKDDQSSYKFADGTQRSYRAGIYDSPFWTVNENPFNDDVNRLIGNVNLLYSPLDWLKVSYKLGLDHFTERRIRGENINSANNPTGVVAQFSRFNSDLNSDFIVMAEKDINDDLYVTGLIGHNYYSRSMRFRNTVGTTLSIPGYFHISNATDVTSTEQFNEFALHGLYADVKLAYKDQLFLNATVRNDYVSFLPKGNNSYVYPALSLGWDFSQTLGLAEGDIFSYGKLRASWGQTGNTIFAYATQTYYNQAGAGGDGFINGNTFPAYGVNAFNRSTTIGNANLEPELTTSFEVGGEFKFLKGRIGLDLTYYSRVTEGQIIAVTVSAASGGTSTFDNTGDVENSGLEIVLDAEVLKLGDFKWDFQGNFTTYTNTVTSLADGVDRVFMGGFTSASSNAIAGEPFGVLYGSKFQRNTDGKLIVGSNGWPLRASTDGVVGDPNPDWIIGLRNTFTYKNFSLSTLLDIRIGGDMWNGTVGVMNFWGVGEETLDRTIKGFVYDGVLADGTPDSNGVQVGGTTNNIPVDFADPNLGVGANKWTRYAFGGLVEENIEDASWVRLRELTLNYNLPSSLFDNLPISSATISLTGRNLFLITEYSGIDPEANLAGATGNSFGLEYFGMPNTKSFGAKLNIKF